VKPMMMIDKTLSIVFGYERVLLCYDENVQTKAINVKFYS